MIARSLRAGFTLLEMMVVIVIIGILSTYLVVNVPQFLDRAKMVANEKNQGRIFQHILAWQGDHGGNFPSNNGQRFFLRPWKDGQIEKTTQQAIAFFSPAWPYEQCAAAQGLDPDEVSIIEYLDDWDSIGQGYTSYAGFDTGGDSDARRRLIKSPGSTAIVSDAEMWHRSAVIYLTADGATHRMLRTAIEDESGLDFDDPEVIFRVGPGCGVAVLETVSND